jgi:hypothetical protein
MEPLLDAFTGIVKYKPAYFLYINLCSQVAELLIRVYRCVRELFDAARSHR